MNNYISKLGFDTSFYQFVDVFSTDDWALDMIPQPCMAVIMLYPITKVQEDWRREEQLLLLEKEREENACKERGGSSEGNDSHVKKDELQEIWYIKQRIGNACGTIGILHALANIPNALKSAAITPQSWLSSFFDTCPAALPPITKAEILESNNQIESMHDEATSDTNNQTSRGNIEDKVETHFVSIVNINGTLVELDGRKDGPIPHGPTTEMSLLKDACQKVVKKFMERDPNEVRFTILALAPSQSSM